MKRALPWILAGAWAVVLLWWSWGSLRAFLANAGPSNIDPLFAAIGAAVVGLAPVYAAWRWHRWSQKRLEKSLTKERDKLDRRLERMGSSPAGAAGKSAQQGAASGRAPS